MRLVCFITTIYHDARSPEGQGGWSPGPVWTFWIREMICIYFSHHILYCMKLSDCLYSKSIIDTLNSVETNSSSFVFLCVHNVRYAGRAIEGLYIYIYMTASVV